MMADWTGTPGSPASTSSTAPTDQELLDATRAAINATLGLGGVQDYELAGKMVKRYDLSQLRDLEEYYQGRVDTATLGSEGTYARFNRNTR
jgi:hypothetical protein